MAALPSLPSAHVPAAASQARSALPSERSAAPNDRSSASDRSTAPNAAGVAAVENRATADQAGASPSFESVLEAQLGLPSGAKLAPLVQGTDGVSSAGGPAAKEHETEPVAATQPDAAFLFLPANILAPPTSNPLPAAGDAVVAAGDGRQDGGRALPPVPGTLAAAAEPVASQADSSVAQDPATKLLAPASLAATLQALPANQTEDRPAVEPATRSAAPDPAPVVPMLPMGERRLEAAQGSQQPANTVPGVVGEPHWGDAFSQRVVWMVGQQVHSAQFRVEPPQLGPIEVKLSITNDQATLTFAAPHAAARDAIQMSLPRLQEMLLESGVTLGSVFVGAHTPQNQREAATDGDGTAGARGGVAGVAESTSIDASLQVRRALGLIDLYA